MIDYLQRFRVGKRMFIGFGLLLALMGTISLTALYSFKSMSHEFNAVGMEGSARLRYANRILVENNVIMNSIQAMFITSSTERMERYNQDLIEAQKRFDAAYDSLTALPTDSETRTLLNAVSQTREESIPYNAQMADLAIKGLREEATTLMRENGMPALIRNQDALKALLDHEEAKMASIISQGERTNARARTIVIVAMIFSLLIGIILAIAVTRSLTIPLSRATQAARELGEGKIDGARLIGADDEVGDVLRAVQQSRDAVKTLYDGLNEMIDQHNAGDIAFYPDPSVLPGDYSSLSTAINTLVSEHVGAALAAGRMADAYARGDLSQDFPRLPGGKAELMNAMDNVKASLQNISNEILHISQAAMHGDFTVRGDESKYQFGFREMVSNLNQLMATSDSNLQSLSSVFKAIAQGDLTARMDGNFEGVFAVMRDDANATVANLTQIVGRIQQATTSITNGASEIATGNSDLSRRTEQQAANLEETAASMEELTSTVRQNAEHARQANQLAIGATDVALSGGKAVGEVVQTMQGIEESSKRIADIISVIDGIAFQTNILALNAAVEAARAGEQGRGFAVVASEVRTLAQRSASAAKEIKDLIDDSVSKVTAGSSQVRKAGDTMEEIVTSVQRVTGIMAEISAASQEQSSGIEQVNQTIVQMDETTQQNAALVEEASAAARAMEEQAHQLANAVSVFRMHQQSVTATAPTPANHSARTITTVPANKAEAIRKADAKQSVLIAPPKRSGAPLPANDEGEWQEF